MPAAASQPPTGQGSCEGGRESAKSCQELRLEMDIDSRSRIGSDFGVKRA